MATPVNPIHIGKQEKVLIPTKFGRNMRIKRRSTDRSDKRIIRYAVSDGSVKNGEGTFGWITGNYTQILATGSGWVEAPPGLITSYQAEAQGLVDLIQQRGIDKDTRIFLDNLAVIGKVNQTTALHPLHPEWDLLEPIRRETVTR